MPQSLNKSSNDNLKTAFDDANASILIIIAKHIDPKTIGEFQ